MAARTCATCCLGINATMQPPVFADNVTRAAQCHRVESGGTGFQCRLVEVAQRSNAKVPCRHFALRAPGRGARRNKNLPRG
jgi:hypothetical protein